MASSSSMPNFFCELTTRESVVKFKNAGPEVRPAFFFASRLRFPENLATNIGKKIW